MNHISISKKRYGKIISLTFLFSSLSLLLFSQTALADTVSNDNYSIDVNTIDTNPQPAIKKTTNRVNDKKIPPSFTTGNNYTVIAPAKSLSISLLQNAIDYGILSPTNPVIR